MMLIINFSRTIGGDKLVKINYLIYGLVLGVFGLIVSACQKTPVETQATQANLNPAPGQCSF